MSEQYSLSVEKRESTGKGSMRRLRNQGYVPGVYYSKKGDNILVQMNYGTFQRVFERAQKSNIVNLEIPGEKGKGKKPVLIWDVQSHPVKDQFLHVDFLGVDLKEEMDVDVTIEVTGKAKGEDQGGIVSIYRDVLSVVCLPTNIPDSIVIDVSELEINENINLDELELPEGVRLKEEFEENVAIVGVSAPAAEESEEPSEEGEEPSEEE